jgi:DNA modification methylase
VEPAAAFLRPKHLYRGDNLEILRQMPSESVDLIYLDPPFFSNRTYEVIWGDEAEVRSFIDRWEGGVEVYTAWMRQRVEQLARVLVDGGSFYLHCDWHASHYLKVMCDEVFRDVGGKFQNEVVWYYRGGGVSKKRWGRRHDVLLFYTKGDKWTFNVDPVRMEYSPESQERLKYTARSFRKDKKSGVERVYDSYRPNPKGKHPDDVWSIQPLMPSNRKRLGYPTQKPEALLRNVVLASSNEGELVLDPFCGCGTTLTVAEAYKRNWIGIDISPTAIDICDRRLRMSGATPAIRGMPRELADLQAMSPYEFQKWVCHQLSATPNPRLSGDRGIDGRMIVSHDPVQVKQSKVGRPQIENFEVAIERGGHDRGIFVGYSFSKDAREEIARAKRARGIEIIVIRAEDLLKEAPTDRIVQELRPEEQLSLEAYLVPRAPKEQPKADDLVVSELRTRQQREAG